MTGMTRCSSTSGGRRAAWGRVLCPPTSMMSTPAATISLACSTAASTCSCNRFRLQSGVLRDVLSGAISCIRSSLRSGVLLDVLSNELLCWIRLTAGLLFNARRHRIPRMLHRYLCAAARRCVQAPWCNRLRSAGASRQRRHLQGGAAELCCRCCVLCMRRRRLQLHHCCERLMSTCC